MITKTNNFFSIDGKEISYIIEITDTGAVLHSYFGKKLRKRGEYISEPQLSDCSWCTDIPTKNGKESLEREMTEYPSYGYIDMHNPMYIVENADGNCVSDLRYKDYKIKDGVSEINGMPHLTVGNKNAQTLELILEDKVTGLEVVLCYTVFEEYNIIARNVRLANHSNGQMKIKSAYSGGFGLKSGNYDAIYFSGGHANERHMIRTEIKSGMKLSISNATGGSGHDINPFFMVAESNSTENFGNVYAMSFVYSGNHSGEIIQDRYGNLRIMQGINPLGFEWKLKNGECFETPQCIMTFSCCGIGGISRELSDLYKNNLCQNKFTHKERPILINNWEATYFDFNEEKLLQIAKTAKETGIELFVLDDGWFGKRNDDRRSLGDWVVNKEKLPFGINGLATKITDMGLKFGIWFEPEMVNPDSDLYRAHPDWAISVPNRTPAEGRYQYVLDLSKEEVCEYIIKSVSDILKCDKISYVKWDMNRCISDMPRNGYNHQYILGLYKIMQKITKRFPDVLFEGCAGGGGRFDAGILYYMPQIWASDNSDAIARLKIQYSTSVGYPLSSMSAHVTASPNHQIGRITSLKTRADVAYSGVFGYELDITKMSSEELEAMKTQIKQYKEIRTLILDGDFYRTKNPYESNFCEWLTVAKDKTEAFLMSCRIMAAANSEEPLVKFTGLDPDSDYTDVQTGKVYGGDELMYRGFKANYPHGDFSTFTVHLKRV